MRQRVLKEEDGKVHNVSVEDVVTYELCCFSLGIVCVQVFLQLQHTKLQSLQQPTRDQLQQQDRTPHTLTHNTSQYIHNT